jgi:hypothetical protein
MGGRARRLLTFERQDIKLLTYEKAKEETKDEKHKSGGKNILADSDDAEQGCAATSAAVGRPNDDPVPVKRTGESNR